MSFNKRIFTIEMLVSKYLESPEDAIEKAIGKTDGFIFKDEESKEILSLWQEEKIEEAYKLLKYHVSRITDKIS